MRSQDKMIVRIMSRMTPGRRLHQLGVIALLCMAPVASWAQPEESPPAAQVGQAEADAAPAPDDAAPAADAPAHAQEPPPAEPTAKDTFGLASAQGATPEEARALEQYQSAFDRYNAETKDYQQTVDTIVDAAYRLKVAQINEAYNRDINAQTAISRSQRADAIVAFEQFIGRNPRNARYTPDALFRLAELRFEKVNDDFNIADEQYQDQLNLYDAGKLADRPPEPARDYTQTIATFQRLIDEWPDYRQLDGAYYLIAFCVLQEGDEERARDLFLTLIEQQPESRFVPEAWIRVGEYYFDQGDLLKAREAYAQAMRTPDSKFYDKALYKLAWTYYRQDDFGGAIERFKQLVEYSDAQEARTGRSGSVLRSESVQYIAISLAEYDWDRDFAPDPEFGLTRVKQYLPGEKPYEREVMAQLVDYLFEAQRFPQLIDISRFALERFPDHPENPQLHEKLVLAMMRDGDMSGAFAERRRLGVLYGPDSAWYAKQRELGNIEATRYANNMVRDTLINSALWYHEQAQKEREQAISQQDEAMLSSAREKYGLAAQTYQEFIDKNPNDKDVYQWTYYLAECLFYSSQFLPAFDQYQQVRETDLRVASFLEIQQVSAFNAIKALEFKIEELVRAGELPPSLLPQGGQAAAPESANTDAAAAAEQGKQEVVPQPIPALVMQYITAIDRFVVLDFKPEEPALDARLAFQAAKILYDYRHFKDARRRFDWIIGNYNTTQPEKEIASFSASLMLETYRLERDYEGLSAAAARLKATIDLPEVEREIAEYELAALFKAAEADYNAKRYTEAVNKYMEVVVRDSERIYTIKALVNAAVANEQLKRYDAAMQLYERVSREYPNDPLASYALYRVAVNAKRFFDFDRAVTTYLSFYERYGSKPTPEGLPPDFKYEEKGAESLKEVGLLLEDLQRYEPAAKRYEEFIRKYPQDERIGDVQWQAVKAWEKAGKTREMIAAIETYASRFGTPATAERVLEGLMMVADYHAARKSDRDAAKWYERTLSSYVSLQVQPGTNPAYHAAKAQFMLVEQRFAPWDKIKLSGSLNNQKKKLAEKTEGLKALSQSYNQVFAYQNLEWTMAAAFRNANLYQRFAVALYEAPVPFNEGTEEWDMYRQALDDQAVPLEDKAVADYEALVAKAREDKIVNEWTKRAIDELNKYKPQDYPLYKEERQASEERSISGMPLLDGETLKKMSQPAPTTQEGGS